MNKPRSQFLYYEYGDDKGYPYTALKRALHDLMGAFARILPIKQTNTDEELDYDFIIKHVRPAIERYEPSLAQEYDSDTDDFDIDRDIKTILKSLTSNIKTVILESSDSWENKNTEMHEELTWQFRNLIETIEPILSKIQEGVKEPFMTNALHKMKSAIRRVCLEKFRLLWDPSLAEGIISISFDLEYPVLDAGKVA